MDYIIDRYYNNIVVVFLIGLSLYIGIIIGRYVESNKKEQDYKNLSYKNLLERKIKLKPRENSSSVLASSGASLDGLLANNNNEDSKNDSNNNVVGLSFAPDGYNIEIITAKNNLCSLLDIDDSSHNDVYNNKQWILVRTANNVNAWISKSKEDGILIRGNSRISIPAKDVAKWLVAEKLEIGLEGIADKMDIIKTFPGESFVVRRVISTRSNLISSKRCFVIITDTSLLPNGNIIIVSKSIENERNLLQGEKKSKKSYVSGIVHCSGYVISPCFDDNGVECCNIHFGVHCDMMGSTNQRRKKNAQKAETILSSLLATIGRLHTDYSMIKAEIILDSWVIESNDVLYGNDTSTNIETVTNRGNTLVGPSQDNDLLIMANCALTKIRKLHESKERSFSNNSSSVVQFNDDGVKRSTDGWDKFYDQDGISVSELPDNNSPIGILSAFCKTDAPPHVVRNLLLEHPDVIDGLLVGRSILHRINEQTHVQWLAYGAIWPVGARDFLIVTTEEPYNKSTGEGFIIVSTSIDDICEEEESSDDDKSETKFIRSRLRLAGYVGVINDQGGTDLSLFVDVDIYAYIQAWLLQILAQYGLSEMMTRIRRATVGLPDLPKEKFELNKILTQIQGREAKMMKLLEDSKSISTPITTPNTIQRKRTISADITTSVNDIKRRESNSPLPVCDNSINEEKGDFSGTLVLAKEAEELMLSYIGRQAKNLITFDWVNKYNKKGVDVYTSVVAGSAWQALQATCMMKAYKYDILDILMDDNRIGEYDDMYDFSTMINQSDDGKIRLRRVCTKAIWPTAPRDFLICTSTTELNDGSIIVFSRSAPDSLYPQQKGFVRGFFKISGYWIQETEIDHTCKITLTSHIELGGNVPAKVINMLALAAPCKMLIAIKEIVTKKSSSSPTHR